MTVNIIAETDHIVARMKEAAITDYNICANLELRSNLNPDQSSSSSGPSAAEMEESMNQSDQDLIQLRSHLNFNIFSSANNVSGSDTRYYS